MKTDKKPVIGLVCVILSCVLVIGITLGLLSSANNNEVAAGTTDTTANSPASKPELTWGFELPPDDGSICGKMLRWPCHMGYKSDKKTFDIDNVKLTLAYGIFVRFEIDEEYIEYLRENMEWDIPEFEVYFQDESGNNIHTIREVKESFINEKYRVEYFEDGEYYRFNHSEEITIPQELFTESEGILKICVGGMNVAGSEPEYAVLCDEIIKYQLIGENQVVLSPRRA